MHARKTASEHSPKLSLQLELEKLYNKNQTLQRVRKEFVECATFDFTGYMVANGVDPDFGFDLLTQMALHKRTTLPTLVGILRRHHHTVQDTTDAILRCAEIDLVDWSPTTKQLVLVFNIGEDVQADLDRYQFPLPMVVHPKKVKGNRDTGYLLSRNSLILKDNHHDEDICLDHINRVNHIRFSHDHDTAHMIANRWRDLDRPKEGEDPKDYEKRVKAFEKYDRTAKEVIDLLLTHGNEFYLTHKYDKRGRTYCQGYHVNYQGAPWNKAVLELADKEVVPL
jgi:hypothetical protein